MTRLPTRRKRGMSWACACLALELSAEQAKAANFDVTEADLTDIVAEAVQWAREH